MYGSFLARVRRRVGIGLTVVVATWLVWNQTPGIPVLRAPWANATVQQAGLSLFEREWQPGDPLAGGDGLGPVYNERSCVSCHFQGGVGGGGDSTKNVTAFEVHPVPGRLDVRGGIVHRFAASKECSESAAGLHNFFPIVPGGIKIVGGCTVEVRDFDPVRVQSINATALFGAGWIDRISSKSILHQSQGRSMRRIGRELVGDFGGVAPGRPHILPDGRVGKFGWKAQFATLEEFVASACANELGLGNPMMEQAKPWARHASIKVNLDLNRTQFRSLVAFVDTLPRPVEIVPLDPAERTRVEHGKALFNQIGCTGCHTPELGGVTGVYSDFLLHRISDPSPGGGYSEIPSAPLPDDHPLPDEWKTPPLWGVAASAPYFHDGASPTLEAAIRRHHGTALSVTKAFESLARDERAAIISFLESLKPSVRTSPVDLQSHGTIAMAR
jgi:CxxC motif-containing protein (DUF1111 family)